MSHNITTLYDTFALVLVTYQINIFNLINHFCTHYLVCKYMNLYVEMT